MTQYYVVFIWGDVEYYEMDEQVVTNVEEVQ